MLCAAFLLLALTACRQPSDSNTAAAGQRTFAVTGIVEALEPDGKTVVIQHGAVSNYMQAMTMPFPVKDPAELAGLRAGDAISFHMVVTSDDGWIEHISKLSNNDPAPVPATIPPAQIQIRRALAPLDVGDRLPDYHFTNELGQAVSFGAFKGQVIAFTFFFTKCPFPTACPRLSASFAETLAKLPLMAGAPVRWHLFSISFDPANDTPAALKDYAQRYNYDPSKWSFLTGSLADITDLADQFDEEFQSNGALITHSFRTVVVDADGRVRKIIPGNAWTSGDLVQAMINAAQKD